MIMLVNNIGVVVIVFVLAVSLILGGVYLFTIAYDMIYQFRYNQIRQRFCADLATLSRWCAEEKRASFLLVETIKAWTLGEQIDHSRVREEMRKIKPEGEG